MLACAQRTVLAQPEDVRVHPGLSDQAYPALVMRGGALLAAWISFGEDTLAYLGRVDVQSEPAVIVIDSVPAPASRPSYATAVRSTVVEIAAGCALRDLTLCDVPSGGPTDATRWYSAIAHATPAGWARVHLMDSTEDAQLALGYIGLQGDVNTGSSLHAMGLFFGEQAGRISVGSFDAAGAGEYSHRLDIAPTPWPVAVPIDAHAFVLASAVGATVYRNGAGGRAVTWDGAYLADARYLRLHGPYVLRWFHSGGGSLRLTVIDTSLQVVRDATIQIPSVQSPDNITVVEDAAAGGMLVVCATQNGVVGRRVGADLEAIGGIFGISRGHGATTRPSAVIADGTMYVIWQDSRRGGRDIYINRIAVSSSWVAGGGAFSANDRIHVAPVPAGESVSITFDAPAATDATLIVADMLGAIRMRQSVARGAAGLRLDLRELTPGVYTVVLDNAGRRTTARLVVSG